jgi:hypothetical protein
MKQKTKRVYQSKMWDAARAEPVDWLQLVIIKGLYWTLPDLRIYPGRLGQTWPALFRSL